MAHRLSSLMYSFADTLESTSASAQDVARMGRLFGATIIRGVIFAIDCLSKKMMKTSDDLTGIAMHLSAVDAT